MNSLFQGSTRKKPKRGLRITECILLAVGFVCIGAFVYSHVDAGIYQSYEGYRLDASIRGERPSVIGYLRHLVFRNAVDKRVASERVPEVQKTPPRRKRAPMETGSLVGRLEIPRIKVSAVVREGSDAKTLHRAAGHVPHTALPGENGNVGIAAHRDSYFRNLRYVREGDLIRIETTWGVYEYAVESLKIVMPQNVEVLNETPNPSITLVTCYPFNYVGAAPKRFIVRARQVNPKPPEPSSPRRQRS